MININFTYSFFYWKLRHEICSKIEIGFRVLSLSDLFFSITKDNLTISWFKLYGNDILYAYTGEFKWDT